jgi:hypothetical protein
MVCMAGSDPVLEQFDADIAAVQAELTRLHEMRSWWKTRKRETTTKVDKDQRSGEKGPTTKQWIRQVLAQGGHFSGAEVARAALDLGWKTTSKNPPIVVRNTLKDMEEKGEVARDEHGKYHLLPSAQGPAGRSLFAVEN